MRLRAWKMKGIKAGDLVAELRGGTGEARRPPACLRLPRAEEPLAEPERASPRRLKSYRVGMLRAAGRP